MASCITIMVEDLEKILQLACSQGCVLCDGCIVLKYQNLLKSTTSKIYCDLDCIHGDGGKCTLENIKIVKGKCQIRIPHYYSTGKE